MKYYNVPAKDWHSFKKHPVHKKLFMQQRLIGSQLLTNVNHVVSNKPNLKIKQTWF